MILLSKWSTKSLCICLIDSNWIVSFQFICKLVCGNCKFFPVRIESIYSEHVYLITMKILSFHYQLCIIFWMIQWYSCIFVVTYTKKWWLFIIHTLCVWQIYLEPNELLLRWFLIWSHEEPFYSCFSYVIWYRFSFDRRIFSRAISNLRL